MMKKRFPPAGWAGLLMLSAAALLYLWTLDNGLRPDELTGGDLITHQYAQVEGRPSNAPGYPLYTMGGWLWFRLGRALLGWALNPVQILSLYSTLWGLASLLLLYLILLRLSSGRWSLAALLTLFYAATYFFWYYSVTTEQYTSAVFQTLLVFALAFHWDDRPRDSTLLWLALVCGTMLANMLTTLFILPPLLWFILSRPAGPRRTILTNLHHYLGRPGLLLATLALALLPLLSYGYVYLRGAQHPEWRGAGEWPSAGAWFIQFLTIRQGRDELAPGLSLYPFFTDEFPALMGRELTWLVFWGGLLGLACLGRRRAIFLYTTLLFYFVFCWGYRFGNWFQVIIPAYPIFIIGFGAAISRIGDSAIQRFSDSAIQQTTGLNEQNEPDFGNEQPEKICSPAPPLPCSPAPLLLTLLLTGLLVFRFSASLPRANQNNLPGDTGLDPGWLILADRPDRPAVVVGDFEERVALEYLLTVWGAAAELYPADAGPLPREVGPGTTYITRRAAAAVPELLPAGLYPQAAGNQLIRLRSTPHRQLPPGVMPLDLDFGAGLRLVGWEQVQTGYPLPPEVAARLGRPTWQIALYWQAGQSLAADYTVSVRPLAGGQIVTAEAGPLIQDHMPVWGLYPTHRWQPGEIVRDVYALSLPEGTVPDALQIIVYRATEGGFENLAERTIKP